MSTNFNYLSFGARFYLGQVDRIDQGFKELGGTQIGNDYDFIYANDMGYHETAINYKQIYPNAKLILNIQDLAPHISNFPIDKLKIYLSKADAITTISETVRIDLKNKTGYDSSVIYQPIKNVFKIDDYKYKYKAMFIGRVNDPNKRCGLGLVALQILGFDIKEVVTIGSESPYYGGVYAGMVDDNILNLLYNSVDFVMFPSLHEGMGLPAIEAMAAGAIPIICKDLSTRNEFFNGISEYDEVKPDSVSISKFIAQFMQDNDKKQEFKDKLYNHYLINWKDKVSPAGVANNILDVYKKL